MNLLGIGVLEVAMIAFAATAVFADRISDFVQSVVRDYLEGMR